MEVRNHILQARNDLDEMVLPFWRQNMMYRESLAMIRRENGEITAKLLFRPRKILKVQNNALDRVFREGKDYLWDGESAELKWIAGSDISFFTKNDLEGRDSEGNYIVEWGDTAHGWKEEEPCDSLGRSRFRNALFTAGPFLYEKQIAVTYEYDCEEASGFGTAFQGDRLPNTMRKFENGEPMKIVFYGDSIFVGCDSSGLNQRPPFQPSFPYWVERALSRKYGCRIESHNPSVGGKDSIWGKEHARELVADLHPDFVFIGFGMNDGGKTGQDTAENIRSILETVRAENPACEFLITVPMVANAESGFLSTQTQFSEAYARLAGEGVAIADLFREHEKILLRKDYAATSGNNVNHPNDWLIRVYAMNLLSAFIRY